MKLAVVSLGALVCLYMTLRRSVHLFQLESYQFPGYKRAVKTHQKGFFAPKTLFPMAVFACLAAFAPYFSPLAAAFFVLLNPKQKMKKPLLMLIYLPRVIKLTKSYVRVCH